MTPIRAYKIIAWVSEGGIDCFEPPADHAEALEAAKVFIRSGGAATAPGRMGRTAYTLVTSESAEKEG